MSRSRRGRFATVGAARRRAHGRDGRLRERQARTSAPAATAPPGSAPTQIIVGSIANVTGPLSSGFAPIVNGVQAYFSMINAEGGVDGRTLKLAYQEDDQGSPTTDLSVAQKLVQQNNVFAVVGVGTPFFGGAAYLAQTGTPTFGYAVSTDWPGPAHPVRGLRLGAVLPLRGARGRLSGPAVGRQVDRRDLLRRAPVGRRLQGGHHGHAGSRAQRVVHRPQPRVRRRPHARRPADEEQQRRHVLLLPRCQRERGIRPGHQPERPHHEAGVVQRL